MPWLVGIDEAGYGPNLGPFVMSMAAVRVPDDSADANLWDLLGDAVCRVGDEANGRLVLDDSKRVYSPARGLGVLERNVLPFIAASSALPCPLRVYWKTVSLTPFKSLQTEPWYADGTELPLDAPHDGLREVKARLLDACRAAGVHFGEVRSVAVFPRQFNTLVARYRSKAAVTCWALKRLLRKLADRPGEVTRIHVDKLGGRNYYRPFLQSVFRDRLVLSRCESAQYSSYHAPGALDQVDIAFQPEADRRHLPVALASMTSKYLREVLMGMFNRFWQRHVPDVKPTAGYPGDAARFYADIAKARRRLGIPHKVLWRTR